MIEEWMRRYNKAKAYKNVFMPNGVLTKDAEIVLKDLKKFCNINRPILIFSPVTRTVDPLANSYAEGKREVGLRVLNYLNIDESDFNLEDDND
jgi:hypothetical protein